MHSANISNPATAEFKNFIQNYIYPLLGIPQNNNIEKCSEKEQVFSANNLVFQDYLNYEDGRRERFIFFCNKRQVLFKTKYEKDFSDDDVDLAKNILQMFFKVAENRLGSYSSSRYNSYVSDVHKETNYKYAVQKGICNWIARNNSTSIETLFDKLEKWAIKTYEGKNVTLGFVINPDIVAHENNPSWYNFLDDDLSAVFTDCIHSIIELDVNGTFNKYLSITKGNLVDNYLLTYESAYRFTAVLQKYIHGNRIGVFLLSNGDIIISKNGAIKFVKRNLKWLNFSYDAFRNAFGEYIQKHKISENLLQNIFASMLDVSFSHCGGIIAVATDIVPLLDSTKEPPVLSLCDYLSELSDEEIASELKKNKFTRKLSDAEIRKRLSKRKIVASLVSEKPFVELDRKLRCELISLDGACIINSIGKVCACGAIIKNDSGSSGGGRGAACQKLSRFGFAVKISTDGYIELYIDEKNVYSIK